MLDRELTPVDCSIHVVRRRQKIGSERRSDRWDFQSQKLKRPCVMEPHPISQLRDVICHGIDRTVLPVIRHK